MSSCGGVNSPIGYRSLLLLAPPAAPEAQITPTQALPILAPLQMITAGQMFNILSLIALSILSQYVPK